MALADRFRLALDAGREAVAAADAKQPAVVEQAVAALVLGGEKADLAAACAWLGKQMKRKQGRAVLITNQTDVELYRLPGIVTEYLPTRPEPQTADPARLMYLRRRFDVIVAKWSIAQCATVGPEAERMFAGFAARGEIGRTLPIRVHLATK